MKQLLYNTKYVLMVFTVGLYSCYVDLNPDSFGCENGRGSFFTESRVLPNYSRITNTIGANIIISQNPDEDFRITAQQNILNDITTRVIDGELIIDYRGCFRNADVDIFISNPEITAVHNAGSGDIYGDNLWQTDRLELGITGSGKIDVEFLADQVVVNISGSGRMELFGSVQQSFMTISGSGNILAFNLESNDQDINISGSGNCEVFARDVLAVQIIGSGNVFYKGNPTVSANISGSGSVIEAN